MSKKALILIIAYLIILSLVVYFQIVKPMGWV